MKMLETFSLKSFCDANSKARVSLLKYWKVGKFFDFLRELLSTDSFLGLDDRLHFHVLISRVQGPLTSVGRMETS